MFADNCTPEALKKLLTDLMRFIIEKSKNVESPFNLYQLIEEFKEKNGTSATVEILMLRLQIFRLKIPESNEFDNDLKVKMVYGLGIPIEDNLLNELKKEAEVEVDDKKRIIKYQKNGGGLRLGVEPVRSIPRSDIPSTSQSVLAPQFSETEQKLLEILATKSQNESSPMTNTSFIKEFKALTGISKAEYYLKNRYNFVKDQIHICTEYDKETRIKMIFVSSAKVNGDFLKELRKDAVVEVDEQQRVKKYKANDGSLELIGDHSHSAKTKKGMAEWRRRSGFVHDSEKKKKKVRFEIPKSSNEDEEYENLEDEDESTEQIENERDDDKMEFSKSPSKSCLKRKIVENSPACSFFSKIVKREGDSDVQDVPKETSYQAAENSVEMINSKDSLKVLRNLVYALDTPMLRDLQNKIEVAVENLGDHDHKVPVDDILLSLNTGLRIMMKSAILAPRQVDSTCFKEFLLLLRCNLFTLNTPALNSFQQKIKEAIREHDAHKSVPIQSIRLFLETLFLMITC